GAAVINVWSNGRATFSTPNTVAKFAVICVVLATPISATVGITTLVIAGYAEWANFANIWLTWWLGDMIGALVVTPVVVLCALTDARAFRSTELTKPAAVISLAVAVGFIAFNPLFKQSQHPDTLGFLAVLPLLWAALHRGPRDTAIASFILAGFSIWGTFSAAGPFAPASLNDSLLFVLVFLISVSVPSLALSADVAMRKTIEENLRRTHTELDRRVEMRTAELAAANQHCGTRYRDVPALKRRPWSSRRRLPTSCGSSQARRASCSRCSRRCWKTQLGFARRRRGRSSSMKTVCSTQWLRLGCCQNLASSLANAGPSGQARIPRMAACCGQSR